MLIAPDAWHALLGAGVEVRPSGHDTADLRLQTSTGEVHLEVKVYQRSRPLTPSSLRRLANQGAPDRLLIVVPTASPAVLGVAAETGASVIALNEGSATGPTGVLIPPDHPPISIGIWPHPPASPRPRGRTPYGSFAIMRRLLMTPVRTQVELASSAGISQPRVSQVLRALARQGLVRHIPGGSFAVRDWDGLLAVWLASYPGPGGIASYWFGLDPPTQQAELVLAQVSSTDLNRPPVLSGDVAADFMAPWRRPRRAIVYATAGSDLGPIGLTPSTYADATVELIVPADPGVWPAPGATERTLAPLADWLQVLWDVQRTGGPDADQAVARLVDWLREQAASTGTYLHPLP